MTRICFYPAICVLFLASCATTGRITPPEAEFWSQTVRDGQVVEKTFVRSKGAGVQGENISDYSDGQVSAGPYGGETGAVTFTMFKPLESMAPLYVIGGLAVVGGVALGYLVSWSLGLMVSAGGIGLIVGVRMVDQYPWLMVIPALAVLGAVGYGIYRLWRGGNAQDDLDNARTALKAVVRAVDQTSGQVKGKIKENVKKYAGDDEPTVRAEVEAVKR